MQKAIVSIKLKKGVADPEGANTKKALEILGFKNIKEVKSVKVFEIYFEGKKEEVEKMCEKLLANPVIHEYHIKME